MAMKLKITVSKELLEHGIFSLVYPSGQRQSDLKFSPSNSQKDMTELIHQGSIT